MEIITDKVDRWELESFRKLMVMVQTDWEKLCKIPVKKTEGLREIKSKPFWYMTGMYSPFLF
jgi:hypothetical protein